MIPFLAGLFCGLALGVVIGLHAVYRQSGAEPWREPYQEYGETGI